MDEVILDVQHLKTFFYGEGGTVRASDDLSYQVHRGECVAIIGESGSGKSVSALSVMRLIPTPPGQIVEGKILFEGRDLLELSDNEMQQIRGSKIGMIFQEPSTALDPVMPIGKQIAEALRVHKQMGKKAALQEAVELLLTQNEKTYVIAEKVGYTDPNYFSYVFKKQFGMSPSKYKTSRMEAAQDA